MAIYSEIVKGIRSKFVGTAEEHELLLAMQRESSSVESESRKKIEDEYRERIDALDLREMRVNALAGDSRIDDAVFSWLESSANGSSDDWSFGYVVRAMRGRGLKAEHLEKIALALKDDEGSR